MKIIAISFLLNSSIQNSKYVYEFHFKGVLAGIKINKIKIINELPFYFKNGENYFLFLKVISCHQGIIEANLLKFKEI